MNERDKKGKSHSLWPKGENPLDCSIVTPLEVEETDTRLSPDSAQKVIKAAASRKKVYDDGYTMLIAPRSGGGWFSEHHPDNQKN